MNRIRSVDTNPVVVPAHLLPRPLTDADRYAKCAVVVTELFSEHLAAGRPLHAKTTWVRFLPTDMDGPALFSDVPATASLGLGEVHEVPYARKVLDRPDDQRRLAILDWLREHMLALAAALSWDVTPIEDAYQACRRDGCRYLRTGAAKSSPDRRRKAHAAYEIDGDGAAWSWIVVTDRAGAVEAVSDRHDSPAAAREGRKVLRSVRWDGDAVTWTPWTDDIVPPGVGGTARFRSGRP
ncbi:hypothetical protein SAMN05421748_13373 [Paractinoplanes atraurantiacus]|uniref:Uncharacterized protein n=1 Tax=Paractinoplanes atraurantiacus TaxID=1036182 RepID=A0A285K8P4_9ACTN|nr:hypothetical protein SAMN05421748_13373 [Actinoplanes atraurantiacus]